MEITWREREMRIKQQEPVNGLFILITLRILIIKHGRHIVWQIRGAQRFVGFFYGAFRVLIGWWHLHTSLVYKAFRAYIIIIIPSDFWFLILIQGAQTQAPGSQPTKDVTIPRLLLSRSYCWACRPLLWFYGGPHKTQTQPSTCTTTTWQKHFTSNDKKWITSWNEETS